MQAAPAPSDTSDQTSTSPPSQNQQLNQQQATEIVKKIQYIPEKKSTVFDHPWSDPKPVQHTKKTFDATKSNWAALPKRAMIAQPRKPMPSVFRNGAMVGGGRKKLNSVVKRPPVNITWEKRDHAQLSNLPFHIEGWKEMVKKELQKYFDKKAPDTVKIFDIGTRNHAAINAVMSVNSWEAVKKTLSGEKADRVEITLTNKAKSKWRIYIRHRSRTVEKDKKKKKILIFNYSNDPASKPKLKQTLQKFGLVAKLEHAKRNGGGEELMYICMFERTESAHAAVTHLHNAVLDGNIITVVARAN